MTPIDMFIRAMVGHLRVLGMNDFTITCSGFDVSINGVGTFREGEAVITKDWSLELPGKPRDEEPPLQWS